MPPTAGLMLMVILQSLQNDFHVQKHERETHECTQLNDFSTVFKVSANLKLNENTEVKKELVGKAHDLVQTCSSIFPCEMSPTFHVFMLACR